MSMLTLCVCRHAYYQHDDVWLACEVASCPCDYFDSTDEEDE